MRLLFKYAIFLTSVSIYTWFVGSYIGIMLLLAAIVIIASCSNSKWILSIPILFLIIGYVVLKYINPSNTLSLPIGYSVFAFTCISYIVDTYKTESKENRKLIDILCYLFFFPKMLAGPIVRFADLRKQLDVCKLPSAIELYTAFKIIVYASFCKFVVADNLSIVNDFENSGLNAWLSAFLFAFQLYLDFYAYSNYAIAFALFVGIKLPESFNSPYHALTFRDFWHRWNITVSSWLKDYVYIPLGGNKNLHKWRVNANIMLTFLVSGLWHGVAFPFVIWGVLHGTFVIIERIALQRKEIENRLVKGIYRCYVFVISSLLWQMFRIDGIETCVTWFRSLFSMAPVSSSVLLLFIIAISVVSIIDCKVVKNLIFITSDKKQFVYQEVAVVCAMFFFVLLFHSQSNINFFYFKF